jgi:drug/metabolite transporter (DMT)-like permease
VATSLFGRHINRRELHSPLIVTIVSMGIGSIVMLALGLVAQGTGELSAREWAITGWLALVNTALTFTIWNNTLRTLTAMESSIINSLMMPQIAIMGYVFLRESLALKEIFGLILVGTGVVTVQLRRSHATVRSKIPAERTVQDGRSPDLPH